MNMRFEKRRERAGWDGAAPVMALATCVLLGGYAIGVSRAYLAEIGRRQEAEHRNAQLRDVVRMLRAPQARVLVQEQWPNFVVIRPANWAEHDVDVKKAIDQLIREGKVP